VLRRWLASLLPPCPAREDVTAVANELASNAIRHTRSGHGGWFAAEITCCPLVMRVAVADGGAPTGPRLVDDPASEHGRGLLVVRGLSTRTGVRGDQRSRTVWADIRWDPITSQPAATGSPGTLPAAAHQGQPVPEHGDTTSRPVLAPGGPRRYAKNRWE
jgi:hypothetical protein